MYNSVSSGMEMNLSAMDILGAMKQGYGLLTSGADFVENHIPAKGTYSYGVVGDSSSALEVRWNSNKKKFHELLNNP